MIYAQHQVTVHRPSPLNLTVRLRYWHRTRRPIAFAGYRDRARHLLVRASRDNQPHLGLCRQ
jgi:hypothetical protein